MKGCKKSGIYKISFLKHRIYIGSAINFYERWRGHLKSLKSGKHCNTHLQRAFNKYKSDFKFEILEYCEKEKLIEREQHYLDTLLFAQEYIRKEDKRFLKLGFNVCPIAGNTLGVKCLPATIEKIRKSKLGKKRSLESRTLQSLSVSGENNHRFGKISSKDTREKISKALLELYSKTNHPMIGTKRSAETKRKLSEAMKGEKHWLFGKISHLSRKVTALHTQTGIYSDFPSLKLTSIEFGCDPATIANYIKSGKILKNNLLFYDKAV